jgi:hypothetical protein
VLIVSLLDVREVLKLRWIMILVRTLTEAGRAVNVAERTVTGIVAPGPHRWSLAV